MPIIALLLAAACLGGGQPPTATPASTASPLPLDVPLDLDLADKLLHDGDVDQALAIYNAVAKSGADAVWRRAVQSAAHIHYDRGEFEAAAAAMIAFLDSDPPAQERGPALLLLGAAQQQAGQADEARESLEEYIESDGVAAAHAHLKLASALSADGDDSAAIEELELALTEELPPPQETEALFALARNQEAAEREADALVTWKRLSEDAATPFERGEALWLLATLASRIGDEQRYQDALVTLALDYPWHPRALESLSRPQLAPVPTLSTADRGVVLFRHRSNEQAQETFRLSLEEDASAAGQAKGRYYLALLAERAGQPDEALTEYDAALAALEDLEGDSLFGEAAWARALLLESLGRSEEAVAAYVGLGDASPGSERTPEALFRAGLLRFRAGRIADAIFHWTRYLETAEAPDRARARFWLAQAALAVGDTQSANLHLTEASQIAPWSYFGLRAVAILEAEPPLPLDEPVPETPATDWTAVQTWLASWAGPEDTAAIPKLTDDSPWRRGLELLLAGLQDEADDQFAALTNDLAGQPWPLYRLARALDDQGQVPAAARAASRLIGDRVDAPPDILRLAYPSDYLDLATAEAEANGFPPLLLLALIRQESFFQPDAESFAGALGLTQVIPTTADEIAGQLDEPDFAYSDLLRPTVSLRFGAHYLGSQLELFAGDIPAALAAYNGGPGNSLRWQEAAAGDPDVLLETIDLSETRAYVQLVLEHYARYRLAYGLAEGPTLPLP
ncbi:MAG: transglycosylase SLT domain-containing protein [Chloroflexi bacterium]|nr:transglycosylase SLT domain-containing protein [Chloroflexota bacterium]